MAVIYIETAPMAYCSKIDYALGCLGEAEALGPLREVYGATLAPNPFKYAPFDYTTADGLVNVELKSRRVAHDAYPTTVVPLTKIAHAESEMLKARNLKQPIPRFAIAVKFINGLFVINYPFQYEVKILKRNDRDRGVPHAYFNVSQMRPVGVVTPSANDFTDDDLFG